MKRNETKQNKTMMRSRDVPVFLAFLFATAVFVVVNGGLNNSAMWWSSKSSSIKKESLQKESMAAAAATASSSTSTGSGDWRLHQQEKSGVINDGVQQSTFTPNLQMNQNNNDALTDIGYKNVLEMMHDDLSDLVPIKQPVLHGQTYLATPVFNIGGPRKVSYKQFLAAEGLQGTQQDWHTWLDSSKALNLPRPSETVVKLIVMMKDEWPLTKQWVLYHGEIVGFHNLYILDGSTDPRSLSFLVYARDQLGANVIFSPATLNELYDEINLLVDTLAGSADFFVKMDADEYLALHQPARSCQFGSSSTATTNEHEGAALGDDCTLSPYGLVDYLKNSTNLATLANGQQLRIGSVSISMRDRILCDAGGGDQIGLLPFRRPGKGGRFKTVHDARTTKDVNLGGHVRPFHVLPPHTNQKVLDTPIGVIHVHFRCAKDEIFNTRKAVVSHGYISENDTDEQALFKLREYTGPDPCIVSSTSKMKVKNVDSNHKILAHAQYLAGCESYKENMYPKDLSDTRMNPDFNHFLNSTLAKYGFKY